MTQDSDDLLALVFSAPIHLAPTQVKQDGDMVITSTESSHFESHHSSSHHEETRVSESHHYVEMHSSSGHHFHAETHEERSDDSHGDTDHAHIEYADRKNTGVSAISNLTSASGRSSLSNHTHQQSYDLPPLDSIAYESELHEKYTHGNIGSEGSDSTVTVVSSHAQQVEDVHTPPVIGEGVRTPIAPYRTPSHDAVIEQFKSLHYKRESAASSVQQEEDHSHLHHDHSAEEHHDKLELLEYEELGFEPLLRMIASEEARVEPHQHHHDEYHHDGEDHRRESHHHHGEHHRKDDGIRHHDSDDDQFTFENVEYVTEKGNTPHLYHESDVAVKEHDYEASYQPEHTSHGKHITTTTTTTTNKLYDPYADPIGTHRDDVSEELIKHVVEPMIPVKELLHKLETRQYRNEIHEKPRKEINIFESLDDNANYKDEVKNPVPVKETHYHQFHELRYRQPRDISGTALKLHHYEHKDHSKTHHHHDQHYEHKDHSKTHHHHDHHYEHKDHSKTHDYPQSHADHHLQHLTTKSHTRVEHAHDHRVDGRNHDDYHHKQHEERYDQEYRNNEHRHDRQDSYHRYAVYDHGHHQKVHHHTGVHHKQAEYGYQPSESSVDPVDENQLSVSELTHVFGGAARLRKPDHSEVHKTHKRTTSVHRIEDAVHTSNVGGNVMDTRSTAVTVHSYQPPTVAAPPAQHQVASPVHHYTPPPVQHHLAPVTSPRVAPTVAPVTVARMPRKAPSDQFNSIRVDFQSNRFEKPQEAVSPHLSSRNPVVQTVEEHKVTSHVQTSPKRNVVNTHQHVQKQQTVVHTNDQYYPKVSAAVQQRAVTRVSSTHMTSLPTPAPVQVPVPAKRELSLATQSHTSPAQHLYYYPEVAVPCCCCNHLMHVHQHQQLHHNQALVRGNQGATQMLEYNNVDVHHAGHHNMEHAMHYHNTEHHVGMGHHLHQHDDHRERADSNQPFVLASVSERRAAYEQSARGSYARAYEGPKPMVDIYTK
ncbi:hypothetical protein GCK32_002360 [Trichostrongylus colubriformis]|uniref:Uncharacterized protein n=1 Tax=Trichostrongylus colubriformis TaxID=6319 RepID=A0AAN8G211_TRICO